MTSDTSVFDIVMMEQLFICISPTHLIQLGNGKYWCVQILTVSIHDLQVDLVLIRLVDMMLTRCVQILTVSIHDLEVDLVLIKLVDMVLARCVQILTVSIQDLQVDLVIITGGHGVNEVCSDSHCKYT